MSLKTYITRLSLIAFLFVSILSLGSMNSSYAQAAELPTEEAAIAEGKTLFENNCQQCHAVHEKVVGPALKNVYKRRDIPWLINFIKNSQKVIASGDEYAVELFKEYGKAIMPSHDFLKDGEIVNILGYIKQQTDNPPVEKTASAADGAQAGGGGGGIPQEYLYLIIGGFVVVLILILVVLSMIVTVLTKFVNNKEGINEQDKEYVNQKTNWNQLVRSNGFIFFIVFLFTIIVAKNVIDGLYTVGVQQGYQPTQPIAFSHELHAGQYEIECQYCHTGVMISKSANIPSANICMNCHSQIKNVGGQSGFSPKIKKIYDALGYDEKTMEFVSENEKPIEWVRVHNLPDLAYFNHSQHVNVGQIECQTCHGPIQEMAVVKQWNTLTMGWCINCHRETKVQAKGNDYYNDLVKAHDGGELKVVDIGGLECSKCHY